MVRGRRMVAIVIVLLLAGAGAAGVAATELEKKASSGLCAAPTPSCLFDITGEIFIGTDAGAGMMNITVHNDATLPFMNITVLSALPSISGLVVFTPFTIDGKVVSSSNQLEVGMYSSGFYEFSSGGNASTPYTVTVQATMTNGQTVTEKTSIVSD